MLESKQFGLNGLGLKQCNVFACSFTLFVTLGMLYTMMCSKIFNNRLAELVKFIDFGEFES